MFISPLQSAAQTVPTTQTIPTSAQAPGVAPDDDTGTDDVLAMLASGATILGVPIAIAAAFLAVRSLRSQADSQKLEAILTTNKFWTDVQQVTSESITLSVDTVSCIRRVYKDLMGEPGHSCLDRGPLDQEFVHRAPFVLGALFPVGRRDRESAPADELTYSADLRARALVLGYIRTTLESGECAPDWLDSMTRIKVAEDFAQIDKVLEVWVNKMNEIAELYETNLMDRRLFIGKRSASLVRMLFVAEPHIIWRNSNISGRWGIRVLGLGSEARLYHWQSPLQQAAIRLADANPTGYSFSSVYRGWSATVGWAIGAGRSTASAAALRSADRKIRKELGRSFSNQGKMFTYDLVREMPRAEGSGLDQGHISWMELGRDPDEVRDAVRRLGR